MLLIIEVADTTIEYDREIKLPLHARHAIPEVWLTDLKAGVLEIYLERASKGDRKLLRSDRQETITPTRVDEVRLPLAEIWPN